MATISTRTLIGCWAGIIVMTGRYENFSRLDGSFELWVKARGRKQQKNMDKV